MNFTKWRFTSPSTREYRPLEEDSSPAKIRPEPKPIIGVKMEFLAFQQDRNQENGPRNYGDMMDLPKPVKSVLHLPQLEANRSNQLQTKHWRPGDQSRHSGGPSNGLEEPEESVPCTSNHMIRRSFIYHNLPYPDAFILGAITNPRPSSQSYNVLESLPTYPGDSRYTRSHWIRRIQIRPEDQLGLLKLAKPTLFMDCLQPIQFGPTQCYLWKPGDHLNLPEDKEHVLSCTSTQWIRRILFIINFPYLAAFTLLALMEFPNLFEDQRLYHFDHCFMKTYTMHLDIPRHQTYSTKLSRFKRIKTFLILGQESHLWPNGYFLLFLILFLIFSLVLIVPEPI